MGLAEKLRALDDRLFPVRRTRSTAERWPRGIGLVGVLFALVTIFVLGVMLQNTEQPVPLGFNCIPPTQLVVEDVLDVPVEGSTGLGGPKARQATATWTSGGTRLVHVTCTSLPAGDLEDARPQDAQRGYVAGDPPFILRESEEDEFAAEMQFVHQSAKVVIQSAEPVGQHGARALVTSWREQVELFADP